MGTAPEEQGGGRKERCEKEATPARIDPTARVQNRRKKGQKQGPGNEGIKHTRDVILMYG